MGKHDDLKSIDEKTMCKSERYGISLGLEQLSLSVVVLQTFTKLRGDRHVQVHPSC